MPPTINEVALALAILTDNRFVQGDAIILAVQALNNQPVDRVSWPIAGQLEDSFTT